MAKRIARISIVSIICFVLGAAWFFTLAPHEDARAYDAYYRGVESFDDAVFTSLDYGLYWYDNESRVPKKAGTSGANFDPDKPTIIFTHGMKINEGYNRRDLVSLWAATNGEFTGKGYAPYMYFDQYYQVLLDMGYNVGQFYWNQLSEVSIDQDVRIWTSDIPGGLSYYVSNEAGQRVQGDPTYNPQQSVAVLAGEAIKAGLGSNYKMPWRLIGHSMGGQLVSATTQNLVYQYKQGLIGANLLPERVSLIDPYLCNTLTTEGMRLDHMGGKAIPAGTWTSELVADALEDIAAAGIAVDAYGGTQFVYRNYVAMTEMVDFIMAEEDDPEFIAARARYNRLTERICAASCWTHLDALQAKYGAVCHCMIIDYYFTTMYEDYQEDNFGQELPGLTSSAAYIRSLRGMGFKQVARNTSDNPFYRHTTDFVRVSAFLEPIAAEHSHVLQGNAEGYATVRLTATDSDALPIEATVSPAGEYHVYGLGTGTYDLTFEGAAGNAVATLHVSDTTRSVMTVDAADARRVTGKTISGEAKGYATVTLRNADTDAIVQTVQVDADGFYAIEGVSNGNYVLRFDSADGYATGNVIVSEGSGYVTSYSAYSAEVHALPSAAMSIVYLAIIPAAALLIMVIVIVLSAHAVKKAKAAR